MAEHHFPVSNDAPLICVCGDYYPDHPRRRLPEALKDDSLGRRLAELESRMDELADKLDKHRHGYRWELSRFD